MSNYCVECERQARIMEKMAKFIKIQDIYGDICKKFDECVTTTCENCIIEYFGRDNNG